MTKIEKPKSIKKIGMLMYISGILNILISMLTLFMLLFFGFTLIRNGVSFVEFGYLMYESPRVIFFLLIPLFFFLCVLYLFITGFLEIKNGLKLKSNENNMTRPPIGVSTMGLITFVICNNHISFILEVIALVHLLGSDSQSYFKAISNLKNEE